MQSNQSRRAALGISSAPRSNRRRARLVWGTSTEWLAVAALAALLAALVREALAL